MGSNIYFFQYEVSDVKIDWHDWKQIKEESQRKGMGEQGQPITLKGDELAKSGNSYGGNGFSGFVSDKISLDRAVKDIRHPL